MAGYDPGAMSKRGSASSRIAAVAALVVAFVVLVAAIGGALGGDEGSGGSGSRQGGGGAATKPQKKQREVPATYTIEPGDTLIGIAGETGVPVAQIEALNPQVDPQILVAGEELKLR